MNTKVFILLGLAAVAAAGSSEKYFYRAPDSSEEFIYRAPAASSEEIVYRAPAASSEEFIYRAPAESSEEFIYRAPAASSEEFRYRIPTASSEEFVYRAPKRSSEERSFESYESSEAEYAFNYAVRDESSENDFGHQETRDGDNTQGSYYVRLPDSRLQKVTYYVDGNSGYVADVSYEGQARFPDSFESYESDESDEAPRYYFDSNESK